jgi:neutral trehalase
MKNTNKIQEQPRLKILVDNTSHQTTSAGTIKYFKEIEECFNAVYDLLLRNLKDPRGKIKTMFVYPGPKYPSAYLWDSAFISGIWRMWDNDVARQIMMPFLDNQLETGACPQTVALGYFVNKKITNPPLITWALLEAVRMEGDYSYFKPIYAKLKKYNDFLYKERSKDGLFIWLHSYESGIDNSPRFTDASEKIKYDINRMWAIDLNCWMVLQNDALAEISSKLGFKDEATVYAEKAKSLKALINQHMWDESSGFYYDFDFVEKKFIDTPTIFSLFPLFVGVPKDSQKEKLIAHIKNPKEFETLVPFPTVIHSADVFMKDCWRGPVWINTSYVVLQALEKIGLTEYASKMAYRLVKGVAMTYANEGSIYEFYDPDNYTLTELSRKKGNFYKQLTLGCKPVKNFCGWTGLVNTLLLEMVLGIRRIDGKTEVSPALPEEWKQLALKEQTSITIKVSIPQFNQEITIVLSKEGKSTSQIVSNN